MSEQQKPRKIAIVGTAEPHWRAAPFDDPSWEIWTCGGIFAVAPRTDRHFELHDKAETCKGWGSPESEAAARKVYWDWLRDAGPKAVLRGSTADAPNAEIYPLDAILTNFPDRYFTNSISWMLALALIEGCTELGIWGVDMALTGDPAVPESHEYARQRPSVEFYLGIAVGMGVRLVLPPETTLLKTRRLYGFQDDDGFGAMMRSKITEMRERVEQARALKRQRRVELIEAEKLEAAMATGVELLEYAKRHGE